MKKIEFTVGSTIGATHRKKGTNNQDSFAIYHDDEVFIGLISDGCSAIGDTRIRSDVGSSILCEFTKSSILSLRGHLGSATFFERLFADVKDRFEMYLSLVEKPAWHTEKYLQATLLGCIITPDMCWIFSCGDGIYFVNGNQYTLLPQEGNSPVYFAYEFMPTTFSSEILDQELRFSVQQSISMDQVDSVLLGSDGLQELIDASEKLIPIRNEPIGHIDQWWTKDLYFRNPMATNNWLRMINEPGYCKDDVTLIGIRKKKEVSHD